MKLAGETALVTGASRGIGQAVALLLAQSGAKVVGTATTESGATSITEGFAALGLDGRGVALDVSDSASVQALFEGLDASDSMPTILVNNAGITRDNLLLRMKDADWEAVLDTNLGALFRMCRACLRTMMKRRHGRIVNLTSVVAATGNPGQTNYAAAKAGVIGFSKSLAREVASRGITVNAVAPGFIDTDMTRALGDEQRAELQRSIPLGRLGTVEDVAEAVLFLSSPAAGYVTGETLHVNGGMFMP